MDKKSIVKAAYADRFIPLRSGNQWTDRYFKTDNTDRHMNIYQYLIQNEVLGCNYTEKNGVNVYSSVRNDKIFEVC